MVNFTHIVDFMIMMPMGEKLMRSFNIGTDQFGLLVSSYTFAAGLAGILSAIFIDKFDRKNALVFLYSGFALSTLACGLAPHYWGLLLCRLLTGGFGGVLSSLIYAMIGDAISAEKRGTAIGIVMGAFSIASILGVPLSLYIAHLFDWHAPFIFLASLSLINLLFILKTFEPMTNHLLKLKEESFFEFLVSIFKNSRQISAISLMLLLILGQFSIIPFIAPSLITNAGLAESQLPLFYAIGGVTSMFMSPLTGRLVDKFGAVRVLKISLLLSIPPILLITNLHHSMLWLVMVSGVLFFMVMAGRVVPAMTLITNSVIPQHRGSFMAISSSSQQFTMAIASFIASLVVYKSSSGEILNFDVAGYFAIGYTLLAIAVVFLNKNLKAAS